MRAPPATAGATALRAGGVGGAVSAPLRSRSEFAGPAAPSWEGNHVPKCPRASRQPSPQVESSMIRSSALRPPLRLVPPPGECRSYISPKPPRVRRFRGQDSRSLGLRARARHPGNPAESPYGPCPARSQGQDYFTLEQFACRARPDAQRAGRIPARGFPQKPGGRGLLLPSAESRPSTTPS